MLICQWHPASSDRRAWPRPSSSLTPTRWLRASFPDRSIGSIKPINIDTQVSVYGRWEFVPNPATGWGP